MNRDDAREANILSGVAFALWEHAVAASGASPALGAHGFDPVWDDKKGAMAAAGRAAKDLVRLIREANSLGARPLSELYARVHPGRGTTYLLGEFGSDLARACVGEESDSALLGGLLWRRPTFDIEFADDELVWEGGVDEDEATLNPPSAHRNPLSAQVLLLEDDPALQKSTSRMLKKIFGNPTIYVADNVASAIGTLEVHDIKLIVSDVDVLGPRSGIDLFRWVKANRPDLIDRYIFFTGNMAAQDEHYRVLMKPAGVEEFRAVLHAPAPGGRARSHGTPPASPPPPPPPPRARALTTAEIAQAVREVMPTIKTEKGPDGRPRGRFGSDKVFIAAIWRRLATDPRFTGTTRQDFDRALVEANRQGLLDLARADLVAAMDPDEVAQSEIRHLNSTFNFVRDPEGRW